MSRENVEIVHRAFEAYNRNDIDTAVADFASDCQYVSSGALPGSSGVFRGPEGYKQFVGWLRSEFKDAQVEITESIDAGDSLLVSVAIRGRGRRSGAPTSWSIWQLWTLQGGKFNRGQGFTDKKEALKAAGLSG
jgi:ketosteroid isomerase-like protein